MATKEQFTPDYRGKLPARSMHLHPWHTDSLRIKSCFGSLLLTRLARVPSGRCPSRAFQQFPTYNMDEIIAELGQHTKAPWTVQDMADACDQETYIELQGDHGSKPIAHLYTGFFAPDDEDRTAEEQEADAAEYEQNIRLITAAPELLQCVKSLNVACEDRLAELHEEVKQIGLARDDEEAADLNERITHYELLKKRATEAIDKVRGK